MCSPELGKKSAKYIMSSFIACFILLVIAALPLFYSESGNFDATLQRLTALDIKTDKQPKSNT